MLSKNIVLCCTAVVICSLSSFAWCAEKRMFQTEHITYKPSITNSIPSKKGSCWTSSIVAPTRSDAFRCSVGNEIADPCFVYKKGNLLVCVNNPIDPHTNFLLKLIKPLPSQTEGENQPKPTIEGGWFLQLADGSVCSPFQGTLPIVRHIKQRASYSCDDQSVVFEKLQTNGKIWRAKKAKLVEAKEFGSTATHIHWVPIKTIWQ